MLSAEDEIGELARALATREEAVQRFLEREQQFTADVSHELRTPLTVILGAAEVVKLRATQSGDRPSLDAAERILRTARDAGSIVAAFLLLSRPPNREFSPQLALLPLLQRDIEQQRLALGNKPVRLEFNIEAHPIVHGAPELVSATIGNLVRNACQYTTEGFVTVTLRPDRVVVEDSGPGLGLALREKLLSSKSPGCPEPAHGSGRGLSIVYRIAEHLGWQVVHEQSPSGGTRFTVLFAHG
jgi:signal transduction histidine kinase